MWADLKAFVEEMYIVGMVVENKAYFPGSD
jgi:hypothetical protein